MSLGLMRCLFENIRTELTGPRLCCPAFAAEEASFVRIRLVKSSDFTQEGQHRSAQPALNYIEGYRGKPKSIGELCYIKVL